MSDTPRTDAQRRLATSFDQTGLVGMAAHAEELERELAAAKADAAELRVALSRIAGRCDAEASYKIARAALAKEKA
jgi:hypothetical protein